MQWSAVPRVMEPWVGWGGTHQELALGLAAAALGVGGEVFPEKGVVDVAAAVEVEEGRLGGGGAGVVLGQGLGQGLGGRVEAVDVGLVVLGVVQLHDLARNVGLEGAVVVWGGGQVSCVEHAGTGRPGGGGGAAVHGRSGRVALPRTKAAEAMAAAAGLATPGRRPARSAGARRSRAADMMGAREREPRLLAAAQGGGLGGRVGRPGELLRDSGAPARRGRVPAQRW